MNGRWHRSDGRSLRNNKRVRATQCKAVIQNDWNRIYTKWTVKSAISIARQTNLIFGVFSFSLFVRLFAIDGKNNVIFRCACVCMLLSAFWQWNKQKFYCHITALYFLEKVHGQNIVEGWNFITETKLRSSTEYWDSPPCTIAAISASNRSNSDNHFLDNFHFDCQLCVLCVSCLHWMNRLSGKIEQYYNAKGEITWCIL